MLFTVIIILPSPLATGVKFSITLDDLFFEFGIHDVSFKIEPYLPFFIILTIKASTGHRAVFVYSAQISLTV